MMLQGQQEFWQERS